MAAVKQKAPGFDLRLLLRSNDLFMALGVVSLVALMIVPVSTGVVDLIVVLNLGISMGLLLLVLYISKPLDFSIFPTILLLITLLRLGLNIAASRLILLSGNPGSVISAFGSLVLGGNYVVGVVVFLIIMVIQFTVINAGSGRVAEVGARFTLDAMPGKQMSIDADLNAGIITETEAKERRKAIQAEADFYGAMDGATKFVKGDATAAILIMIVNILGGYAIGVLMRGEDLVTALQTYVLYTVGAGLSIQIPALLVSTAAGLIVTRTASDMSVGNLIVSQLSNLKTIFAITVIIFLMVLVPGFPKLPFILVGMILAGASYLLWTAEKKKTFVVEEAPVEAPLPSTPEELMNQMVIDPMELEVGYGLIPLVDETRADNLLTQITNTRRQILAELGFVMPVIRIRDNLRLMPQAYRLKIRGEEIAKGDLMVDRYLAIPGAEVDASIRGIATKEPAFGLPALWVSEAEKGRAELANYTVVTPLAVISTHLMEVIRTHASELLSRQMVQEMLNRLREKSPAAVDGLVPELLGLGDLQDVLRNLLRERIPIRDLAGILEVLAKHATVTRDSNILAEAVRQTMARAISNMYREDDGFIHIITLAPQLEAVLRESLSSTEGGLSFQIEPSIAQGILTATGEKMEALAQLGHAPIILCPRELRLAFRRLTEQTFPNLIVMAFSEIASGTKVKAHGMVDVDLHGFIPGSLRKG